MYGVFALSLAYYGIVSQCQITVYACMFENASGSALANSRHVHTPVRNKGGAVWKEGLWRLGRVVTFSPQSCYVTALKYMCFRGYLSDLSQMIPSESLNRNLF